METVVVTHRVPNETHVVGKFNFCRSFRVVKPRAAGAVQPFLQVECESFLPHLLGAFTGVWGSKVGGSSRWRSGDKTADQLLSSAWTHRPPPGEEERCRGTNDPTPAPWTYVEEDRHALGQLQGRAELFRGVVGGRRRLPGVLHPSEPWRRRAERDWAAARSRARARPQCCGAPAPGRAFAPARLPGVSLRSLPLPARASALPRALARASPSPGCWRGIRLLPALSNGCAPRGERSLTSALPLAAARDDPGAPAQPSRPQPGGGRPDARACVLRAKARSQGAPDPNPKGETIRVKRDKNWFCQLCFSSKRTYLPHPPQSGWV